MSQKKMTFSQKFQKAKSSGSFSAALMLAPAVFFLCLCSIYPFIWIFRYVACDYNGFKSTFTGWKNFERMLNDKVFWNSVMHTFEYAFYKLIFIIPLALLMAVLLNQKLRGSSVFRGIYFMPTIISTSIAGMIFGFIFATKNGILNSMLQNMHMIDSPIKWLNSPSVVMVAVTILAIWGGFGNYMLYFITGMTGISEDVYESAKIDGATNFQVFWKITMPYILFIQGPALITDFVKNINNFNVIYLLTQDVFVTQNQALANSHAKEVDLLVTWLFRLTNEYYDYKMASVIGIIVFIICAAFTLISFSRMIAGDKEEEYQ